MVLRFKISPEYVLDEMQFYEIKALLDYEYYGYKDSWEQARLIALIIAQVNSKKQLKPEDILHLYWEDKNDIPQTTQEDIQRLMNNAKQYAEKLKQ